MVWWFGGCYLRVYASTKKKKAMNGEFVEGEKTWKRKEDGNKHAAFVVVGFDIL